TETSPGDARPPCLTGATARKPLAAGRRRQSERRRFRQHSRTPWSREPVQGSWRGRCPKIPTRETPRRLSRGARPAPPPPRSPTLDVPHHEVRRERPHVHSPVSE